MAATFTVSIVTPEKIIYEGQAQSLVAPAAFGYLGVLAHHAPLLASLSRGTISLRDAAGNNKKFPCPGMGFIEVARNVVTLLLESAV